MRPSLSSFPSCSPLIPTSFLNPSQVLSGVSLVSYWVSTALWDWASYLLPASLALLLFALFGVDEFIGPASLLPAALLLFAYGPAVAALTYCFTFGFTHHATAQNAILLLHLFSGLLLSLASFIMSLIKNTRRTNHNLKVRTALGSAGNILGLRQRASLC
jgi:ATP-binding cassette subfamily A (ABC1) protein 3